MNKSLGLAALSAALFLMTFLLPADGVEALGPARSGDGIEPSFEHVGPEGGEVRSLLIDAADSQTVFLGTSDGQMYRSDDNGRSWVPLVPGPGRRRLVIDTLFQHPVDRGRIFAGGWDLGSDGGGLYESLDRGVTWTEMRLPERSPAVRDLDVCRSRPARMVVGTLKGVWISDDSGTNWRLAGGGHAPFETVESVAIDPSNPDLLIAGTWRLAYRSADAGRTWRRIERGMPLDSDVFSLAPNRKVPGVVYASACSGVYRSDNNAESWTRLKVLPDKSTIRAHLVRIDPHDPVRVYAGTTEGLYVSATSGDSWRRLTSPDLTINAFQIDPKTPDTLLIGTAAEGVLRSDDGGRTWTPSSRGFSQRHVSALAPDMTRGGRLLATVLGEGRIGGVHAFDYASGQWRRVNEGFEPGLEVLSLFCDASARIRLAGTRKGAFVQSAPGGSWQRVPGISGRFAVNAFAYDESSRWLFAASESGIMRARPESLNFVVPVRASIRPRAYSLVLAGASPRFLYAATNYGVLRSATQADSWEFVTHGLPQGARFGTIVVSPVNPRHLLVATSAGLYETRDGGQYWRRSREGRLTAEVGAVAFVDGSGLRLMAAAGQTGGVFLSEDGGQNWHQVDRAGFDSPVRQIVADPSVAGRVFLATRTDGVYRVRLPPRSQEKAVSNDE